MSPFARGGGACPCPLDGDGEGWTLAPLAAGALDFDAALAGLALVGARYAPGTPLLIASPEEGGWRFYAPSLEGAVDCREVLGVVRAEIEIVRDKRALSWDQVSVWLEITSARAEEALAQTVVVAGGETATFPSGARLVLSTGGAGARGAIHGARAHYPAPFAQQFAAHCERALEWLSAAGTAPLELLSPDQQRRVAVEYNRTEVAFSPGATLHDLVAEQAAQTPEAVALLHEGSAWTYGELERCANGLAAYFRADLGVQPGDCVGLMVRRSAEMVAAMLGLLKAGAAYVPIDPKHPPAIVSHIVEQCAIGLLVVDSDSLGRAETFAGDLFVLDVELEEVEGLDSPSGTEAEESDLAYVIYTSGSTGLPKGVAVEHRAIVNSIRWRNQFYGTGPHSCNLQLPSFAFDSSVLDIFAVLCAGGRLLIPDEERRLDAAYLDALIAAHGATSFIATSSYYRLLVGQLDAGKAALRQITLAGEATTPELVAQHYRHLPEVELYNEYGPTECAVCATACRLPPGERAVSIGAPIANVKVLVLDADQRLLPSGAVGEIYLGGVGLARGYLGNEALTRARFIDSPLPQFYQGRLYRTGDLGFWREDGTLGCCGRVDNQVKVRGFRIEMDEVERQLLACPQVEGAAVICRDHGGGRHLAAFAVLGQGGQVADLRRYLEERLPYYMVPDYFRILSQMPLNVNGKVDRQKLAGLPLDEQLESGAAISGEKRALLDLCRIVFRQSQLGLEDDFFEVGGNSLKVLEMIAQVRDELCVDLAIIDVYTHPTVQALDRRMEELRASKPSVG